MPMPQPSRHTTPIARGEIDFDFATRGRARLSLIDAGKPITALAGVHPGCYELFAHEPRPHHQRPEGQEGRHPEPRLEPAPATWRSWRRMSGSTRARTSTGSPAPRRRRRGRCSPTGRSTPSSAFPPEPQELRARKIGRVIVNMRHRPARGRSTSAAWLYGNRISSATIRSPPSASCAPSSRPPTSAPPSRRGPRAAGRWRVHAALRLRAPDADRGPVHASGASSTPRTRCASTRCGCTRSA